MKDKCIAIIRKQIIMAKLRREFEKAVVEWFWRVLARVRLTDSLWISKPELLPQVISACDILNKI